MNFLIAYQWELFITIELLSLIALFLFGFVRYVWNKSHASRLFIFLFLLLLALEVILASLIYFKTGEIAAFQIVVAVFLLYACTFGIADFRKLDRWMREKVGNWRGVELLTEKDYQIIQRNKNPKYLAKKYRWSAMLHLVIFVIVQFIFWSYGTAGIKEMLGYVKDLSWIDSGRYEDSPYPNEVVYGIGMIWGIVFIVDFIWSWSYTFFPSSQKD